MKQVNGQRNRVLVKTLSALALATASGIIMTSAAGATGAFDTCSDGGDPDMFCLTKWGPSDELGMFCQNTESEFQCETCCTTTDPELVCSGPNSETVDDSENCDPPISEF